MDCFYNFQILLGNIESVGLFDSINVLSRENARSFYSREGKHCDNYMKWVKVLLEKVLRSDNCKEYLFVCVCSILFNSNDLNRRANHRRHWKHNQILRLCFQQSINTKNYCCSRLDKIGCFEFNNNAIRNNNSTHDINWSTNSVRWMLTFKAGEVLATCYPDSDKLC